MSPLTVHDLCYADGDCNGIAPLLQDSRNVDEGLCSRAAEGLTVLLPVVRGPIRACIVLLLMGPS
jgi:hypothetical protein